MGKEAVVSRARFDVAETYEEFDSDQYKNAKSAFGYFGSKQKLARKILKFLPPHNCWVELFCGSAAITLAKKAVPIEVINDIDGNIVNVFRQLRKQPEKLIEAIELTPYSREEFFLAKNPEDSKSQSDLERARCFLVWAMMSINGVLAGGKGGGFSYSNSYARANKEARVSRWQNYPQRLHDVAERLRDCRIEKFNALDLLAKFANRPATLVYIDPPYLMKRLGGYVNDANDEKFHQKLLNLCNKAKCMIVISGYENELYDDFLTPKRGWRKEVIATHTKATCGKQLLRDEVVWINKVASGALRNNRVPIRLSKREKELKKVNPLRG